jgi:hypothetical protein
MGQAWLERFYAFMFGTHRRLGQDSPVQNLVEVWPVLNCIFLLCGGGLPQPPLLRALRAKFSSAAILTWADMPQAKGCWIKGYMVQVVSARCQFDAENTPPCWEWDAENTTTERFVPADDCATDPLRAVTSVRLHGVGLGREEDAEDEACAPGRGGPACLVLLKIQVRAQGDGSWGVFSEVLTAVVSSGGPDCVAPRSLLAVLASLGPVGRLDSSEVSPELACQLIDAIQEPRGALAPLTDLDLSRIRARPPPPPGHAPRQGGGRHGRNAVHPGASGADVLTHLGRILQGTKAGRLLGGRLLRLNVSGNAGGGEGGGEGRSEGGGGRAARSGTPLALPGGASAGAHHSGGGLTALALALHSGACPALLALDASLNQAGARAVTRLGEALAGCPQLTALDLSGNGARARGVGAAGLASARGLGRASGPVPVPVRGPGGGAQCGGLREISVAANNAGAGGRAGSGQRLAGNGVTDVCLRVRACVCVCVFACVCVLVCDARLAPHPYSRKTRTLCPTPCSTHQHTTRTTRIRAPRRHLRPLRRPLRGPPPRPGRLRHFSQRLRRGGAACAGAAAAGPARRRESERV